MSSSVKSKTFSGNVEIEFLVTKPVIKYVSPPMFPSSNYTGHFGPTVQGVYLNVGDRYAIPMNQTTTVGSGTIAGIYFADIPQLSIRIKTKCISSVIKIESLINWEQNSTDQDHDIRFEIRRYSASSVFQKTVGSPLYSICLEGLAVGRYRDPEAGSTMQFSTLIAFDTIDSPIGTEYLYIPRVLIRQAAGNSLYLNRTKTNGVNSLSTQEQATSHIILHEHVYNDYSIYWDTTAKTWTSRSASFTKKIANDTFTVPSGVTVVYISAMGAGGDGGDSVNNAGGGGGGSGHSHFNIEVPVNAGEIFTVTIGTGTATVITKPGGYTLTAAAGSNGGDGGTLASPNQLGGNGGNGGFGGGGGNNSIGNTPVPTTITAGSNGVSLPTSTINVATTTNLTSGGIILVQNNVGDKSVYQRVAFTGSTATTFTGCTQGEGVMSTGNVVARPRSLGGIGTANYYGSTDWNGMDPQFNDNSTGGNGAGPIDAGYAIGRTGGGGGGPGGGVGGGTTSYLTGLGFPSVANSGAGGGGGTGKVGGAGASGWVIFEY